MAHPLFIDATRQYPREVIEELGFIYENLAKKVRPQKELVESQGPVL